MDMNDGLSQFGQFGSVVLVNGEPRVSSEIVAIGVEQQHSNVIRMVRRYQGYFEEFGLLSFEIRLPNIAQGGGQPVEFAMLNEGQTTFLLSLMRNVGKVILFKFALVKEFFRIRDALRKHDERVWSERKQIEVVDAASKARASFGSHELIARKKQIAVIRARQLRLVMMAKQRSFFDEIWSGHQS
jgi:phage regulator Rha-like protein